MGITIIRYLASKHGTPPSRTRPVHKPTRKRRPELSRPGLKQLTPAEKRIVAERLADHRKRWEYLFSLNVWKPSK
jgi:hypothetical protein